MKLSPGDVSLSRDDPVFSSGDLALLVLLLLGGVAGTAWAIRNAASR